MASFLKICHLPGCEMETTSTCSRCVTVGYCSPEHQMADWRAHKPNCNHLAIVSKIEEVYKNTVTLSGRAHVDELYRLFNDLKYFYKLLFILFKEGRLTMRNNTFKIDNELTKFEKEIEFIDNLYGNLPNSNNDALGRFSLVFYHRISKSIIFLSSILHKYSTPPVNMTKFAAETSQTVDLLIIRSIHTYGIINHPINTNSNLSDKLDILKRSYEYIKDIPSLSTVSEFLELSIERFSASIRRIYNLDGGRRKTRNRR